MQVEEAQWNDELQQELSLHVNELEDHIQEHKEKLMKINLRALCKMAMGKLATAWCALLLRWKCEWHGWLAG